ncbi:PKD domain-containing protein [Chloroflexota bacterium]
MAVKSLNSIIGIAARILVSSRKLGIQAVIIVALIFGLGIGAIPVQAASVSWDGGSGDGLWSTPANWSGDSLPQSDDTISILGSAGEVVLDADFTLIGKINVIGAGNILRIGSGVTLTLDPVLPPGQLDVVIVDNGGTLINDGVIEGAVLSPLPRINVTSSSAYTPDSTIINNGTLHEIDVFLRGGPQNPTLNNNGTMHTVRISTLVGTVINSGIIDDAQLSFQFGTVNNEVGGNITTSFTLSSMGSRFINSTVFDNYGTVTNEATIDNEGIFNNYDTFDNTAGTFINSCNFGAGTVGIFNDSGVFLGNPISNEGSLWDNDSGNGQWSDPLNWTGDILPASTNDVIVNIVSGVDTTVTVDADITIDGRLSIRNSVGSPTMTTLLIPAGVTLTNNDSITPGSDTTINNQGSIVNNGEIRASGSAIFLNTGSFSGHPVMGIDSTWDGSAGNGLWSDPLNWVRNTLPQTGDTISILGSAGEVVLDADFTLIGKINVIGAGNILRIGSGVTLTLDPVLPPGQLDVVIVDNGGTLINDGVIEGAVLSPLPRINVTSSSAYTPDSTIINNGTLHEIDVFLRGGPQNPTLNNNGTMHTVRISTLVGTVINSGIIDDAQLSFQFGTVNNEVGGNITTSFTLSSMGSRFINSTVFDNYGTVTNEATIDNEGIFNNYDTFDNTAGAFDNQGTFYAYCGSTLLGTISGNPVNQIPCNAAPVVDAGIDQAVNEGDPVSLDPATFTDADVTDSHTATISWGDTSPTEPGIVSESAGSGTVSGTHTYTDDGVYTVTVSVSDGEVESSSSFTITVNNVVPIANAGADQIIDEGDAAVFSGSFNDPGTTDTHTITWNFGDSSPTVSGTLTPSHVYIDDGVYQVTLTVTDDDLGVGSDVLMVTVSNLPPEVNAGPDQAVNLGDTASVEAEFTDPGILDVHTATIYWGDGDSETKTPTEPNGGPGSVIASHVYSWPGIYEVTVEVSDSESMDSDALTVEVLPIAEIMIETLSDDIDTMDLSAAIENSLNASLDNAVKLLNDANQKNDVAAINVLEAFINKIEAQRGKKIPDEVADALIAKAQDIITALSGGA